jgi:hypothetical protein
MPTDEPSREYSYEQEQADALRELLHAMADGKRVKHKKSGRICSIKWIMHSLSAGDTTPTDFQICGPEIVVNGVRVPAPLRVAPAEGVRVYAAATSSRGTAVHMSEPWDGSSWQKDALAAGLLYDNEKDCKARGMAMLKFQEV